MSLFSSIQQAASALQISELGLHVVGNNIANANTPGYIRQELVQTPAVALKFGDVILGYGVRAVGVVQKLDNFAVERLRQTESALASSTTLDEIYQQVEAIFGELTDDDISSQLNTFSSAIHDVLNQPGNDALRRLVIERGKTLAANVRNISQRFTQITGNLDAEVRGAASEINRLTEQIAVLNRRITTLEGGEHGSSDAVGLRDERLIALQELSKVVNIRAVEQVSGAVTVFVGGEYLVTDGIQREVTVALNDDGEFTRPEVRLADTDSALKVTGGKLHGVYVARDTAISSGAAQLDDFSQQLIEQFNLIHSQGQGLKGFVEVTGTNPTDDHLAALDLAGYQTGIQNGEFEIQVFDTVTEQTKTHSIRIKLTGAVDDTSLEDVRASLDAIAGLTSTITADGRLNIASDSGSLRFSFQNDNSNFLTALGINTFFTGDSAATLRVNSVVANDPDMLAASLTGVGNNTDNALRLAEAFDNPVAALSGNSIKQSFEDMVVRTTQEINVQSGITDGLKNFYKTIEAQHLAASGVNLDEEAVKMIFYQRAFQANSRIIQASSEMLEVLVNL